MQGFSEFFGENLLPTAALGKFLEAVEKGKVPRGSWLVVEHLDRLTRQSVRKALALILLLLDAGINIKTRFDGKEYRENSETTEVDLLIAIIYLSEAYKSSLAKQKRSAAYWRKKREAVTESCATRPFSTMLTPIRPAWIDRIDGVFVVNEIKGKIILRIVKEVASGLGTYTVAMRLNDDGIPPMNGDKWFREKGTKIPIKPVSSDWNKSRINQIIHSNSLLGWMQPHVRISKHGRKPDGPPKMDYYPIIDGITQTLVDRAKAQIAGRRANNIVDGVVVKRPTGAGRKGETLSNLFTGLAKCAVCGGSMFLANYAPSRNKRGWLHCTAATRNKRGCKNTASVPYAALEHDIIDSIGGYALEATGLEREVIKDSISERIAVQAAEMVKIDATVANMSEAFATGIPTLIVKQIKEMQERRNVLEKETEDLRIKKSLGDNRPSTRQIAMQMLNDLHSPGAENVLEIRARMAQGLRQMLEVVWCCPDRDVIVRMLCDPVVVVTRHCLKDGAYRTWHLDWGESSNEPAERPFLPSLEEKMQKSLYRKIMAGEPKPVYRRTPKGWIGAPVDHSPERVALWKSGKTFDEMYPPLELRIRRNTMIIVTYYHNPKRKTKPAQSFPIGRIVSAKLPRKKPYGIVRYGVPDEAQRTELIRQFMEQTLKQQD